MGLFSKIADDNSCTMTITPETSSSTDYWNAALAARVHDGLHGVTGTTSSLSPYPGVVVDYTRTNFSVQKVENGFTVTAGAKVHIAHDVQELLDQIVVILALKTLEK